MSKRLAIIPARSGSKRIPGKNIRDFHGQPMISYPINAALQSGLFDAIHVSTDSQDIIGIALKAGAECPFKRPENLCDDMTPIVPVLKFVVEEYARRGQEFDTVAMLFATSPMIAPDDLKKACEVFEQGGHTKTVLSMAPFPCPVEWAFRMHEESHDLTPVVPNGFAQRSQDLQQAYYDAAMFYFYNPSLLLKSTGAGSDLDFKGFPVDPQRVVDIDTPDQWVFAEMMYKAINDI